MTKETPGWGGSRKNAGRKQIVRRELLRTDAGRWCENRWRELAEQAAKQRREKRERSLKMFLKAQGILERIQDIPLKHRRTLTVKETLADVEADVDAALTHRKHNYRVQLAKLNRPKGATGKSARAAVIAEAVEWFKERWGITVRPSRMDRFWKEYRRSKKANKQKQLKQRAHLEN